jgi:hypothetical protein
MKSRANDLIWRAIPYFLAVLLYLAHQRLSQSTRPKAEALAMSRDVARIARSIVEPTYPTKGGKMTEKTTNTTKVKTDSAEPAIEEAETTFEVLETKKTALRTVGDGAAKTGLSLVAGVGVGVGMAVGNALLERLKK